jgi:2-polyprenyl-3-methyl-5-hydroxy-6-metoxy-1,4-benzoquinol methylase
MDRECPVCGGPAGQSAFPYATRFNGVTFKYLQCRSCASVFVSPVPDAETFAKMYAKAAYHDAYYLDSPNSQYRESARLLGRFLPRGARVLDYGCGLGIFLKALKEEGFSAAGVEFDAEAAAHAAGDTGCEALSAAAFRARQSAETYDALHLGDVLEHLPDPASTLRELLAYVKPGGLLFAEGPLENNPSPVLWAAQIFGAIKRVTKPAFIGATAPTHLMRVDAVRQFAFFSRVEPSLAPLHWEVQETGWPYAEGGRLKRVIARAATALGGREMLGTVLGNRFRGIFRLPGSAAA